MEQRDQAEQTQQAGEAASVDQPIVSPSDIAGTVRIMAPPPFAAVSGTAGDPFEVWFVCLHCQSVAQGAHLAFTHRAGCKWYTLQRQLSSLRVERMPVAWSHADAVMRTLVLRYPTSGLRIGEMPQAPQVSMRLEKMSLLNAFFTVARIAGMRWTVTQEMVVGLEHPILRAVA